MKRSCTAWAATALAIGLVVAPSVGLGAGLFGGTLAQPLSPAQLEAEVTEALQRLQRDHVTHLDFVLSEPELQGLDAWVAPRLGYLFPAPWDSTATPPELAARFDTQLMRYHDPGEVPTAVFRAYPSDWLVAPELAGLERLCGALAGNIHRYLPDLQQPAWGPLTVRHTPRQQGAPADGISWHYDNKSPRSDKPQPQMSLIVYLRPQRWPPALRRRGALVFTDLHEREVRRYRPFRGRVVLSNAHVPHRGDRVGGPRTALITILNGTVPRREPILRGFR